MTKCAYMQRIMDSGVIGVLRGMQAEVFLHVARALRAGGVEVLEITVDAPGALSMIEKTVTALGSDTVVGAGTVLDPETARAAIMAGAEFIFTPTLNLDVISLANRYGKVVIPGVMTPTEMVQAYEAGALAVKVFPAGVLGPEYIRQVRGPLSHIPMIPTGGVDVTNVRQFIEAGAAAVGVGGAMVDSKAVAAGRFDVLTERAQQLVHIIQETRGQRG